MENTNDDMTITFADFGHFIGSMISKTSTFNAHFRPQFHACQGRVGIIIKYYSLKQILAVTLELFICLDNLEKTRIYGTFLRLTLAGKIFSATLRGK